MLSARPAPVGGTRFCAEKQTLVRGEKVWASSDKERGPRGVSTAPPRKTGLWPWGTCREGSCALWPQHLGQPLRCQLLSPAAGSKEEGLAIDSITRRSLFDGSVS